MISWYIKYNKKQFIASIICSIIVGIVMFYIYFPNHSLFAIYAFMIILAMTYVDTITQIKRYLENNNAKDWLVTKWQLKDSLTYTTFLIITVLTAAIVIHFSPPDIPGHSFLYTTAAVFAIITILKWLRYFEMKREMREGNLV